MLIMAKTKKLVTNADEVQSSEESAEDLEALIKEARGEDEKETDDTSANMNDMEVSFDKLSLQHNFCYYGE